MTVRRAASLGSFQDSSFLIFLKPSKNTDIECFELHIQGAGTGKGFGFTLCPVQIKVFGSLSIENMWYGAH